MHETVSQWFGVFGTFLIRIKSFTYIEKNYLQAIKIVIKTPFKRKELHFWQDDNMDMDNHDNDNFNLCATMLLKLVHSEMTRKGRFQINRNVMHQ